MNNIVELTKSEIVLKKILLNSIYEIMMKLTE